jgi:hypothetical protein
LNFCRRRADELTYDVRTAGESKFLGDDAESAVRGNEVHGFDPAVALDVEQEVLEKQRSAGAGSGYGQGFRRKDQKLELLGAITVNCPET